MVVRYARRTSEKSWKTELPRPFSGRIENANRHTNSRLVGITGHLRTKTHLSGYGVNQDLRFSTELIRAQMRRLVFSLRCFSDPLTTFALRISCRQTTQFVVFVHRYVIIDD